VSHACPDFPTLLAYWFGELDDAREAAIEEHYLGCAACTEQLEEVEALGAGVRRIFAGGRLVAVVTPAFTERLRQRGLRLREYRVPCNGSVNCSVGPDDDVLLSRLQVPLQGVERIDLVVSPVSPAKAGAQSPADLRLEDIPFDAASGEVVVAPSIAHVRTLPAHRQVMRLVAVGADGERLLGEYTFNHSPG
jgi:anti-sigma factor RsiW